jgi:hypothetical protein
MSHLSSKQLADLARLTTRQVQRILERGTPNLGATRTPGGHWIIPDTPEVRRWAREHERWKGRPRQPQGKLEDHITPELLNWVNKQMANGPELNFPNDLTPEAWAEIHNKIRHLTLVLPNVIKRSKRFGKKKGFPILKLN